MNVKTGTCPICGRENQLFLPAQLNEEGYTHYCHGCMMFLKIKAEEPDADVIKSLMDDIKKRADNLLWLIVGEKDVEEGKSSAALRMVKDYEKGA